MIAIIDADLINIKTHKFPNLVCMKLSSFFKEQGKVTFLKTDYNDLNKFEKVYVSRVFTRTLVPRNILNFKNVIYGGTGFFYDKSPTLTNEIEHHFPDYSLYNNYINKKILKGFNEKDFYYYKHASIGFTTRGCFRHCDFCVNKNSKRVIKHSPIEEFLDADRKCICLLDDNLLGYIGWENVIIKLIDSKKKTEFKQGLDMRLMTKEKSELLSHVNIKDRFYFAFDNIKDQEIIKNKLNIWQMFNLRKCVFYILCAYYDTGIKDIIDLFERLKFCKENNVLPYVLRHNNYLHSKFYGLYTSIAMWCNQFRTFEQYSFKQFCERKNVFTPTKNTEFCATTRYMLNFEREYPEVAKKYYSF